MIKKLAIICASLITCNLALAEYGRLSTGVVDARASKECEVVYNQYEKLVSDKYGYGRDQDPIYLRQKAKYEIFTQKLYGLSSKNYNDGVNYCNQIAKKNIFKISNAEISEIQKAEKKQHDEVNNLLFNTSGKLK